MPDNPPLILLVDDDLDFLEMNRHVLESRGYRVFCAPGPQDALEKMAQEKPQVVVTDLMMKSLDSGFLFSRRIKQDLRFSDVPVVIVTSIACRRGFDFRPRTPEELAAMGADAYFEKPVAPQALLSKVQELLARCSQEVSE